MKSSIADIRARFDQDVERFSNLEAGQSATIDAPLSLELVAQAAAACNPQATHVLDIGCGAGNYTLRLLQELPQLQPTLLDLSLPMLERAAQRIAAQTAAPITTFQADIREVDLPAAAYDIIVAAAVLHHLRDESEWRDVFTKCFQVLKPGGSLWIVDLVAHDPEPIQALMWQRYGAYLQKMRDTEYRDQVFATIEREDSPRSLLFQIELLREAGFAHVEILHKNSCFAAWAALKRT